MKSVRDVASIAGGAGAPLSWSMGLPESHRTASSAWWDTRDSSERRGGATIGGATIGGATIDYLAAQSVGWLIFRSTA